jgi:hypothetical protein
MFPFLSRLEKSAAGLPGGPDRLKAVAPDCVIPRPRPESIGFIEARKSVALQCEYLIRTAAQDTRIRTTLNLNQSEPPASTFSILALTGASGPEDKTSVDRWRTLTC